MRIKAGVSVSGIAPEILVALLVASRIWGDAELVVTSVTDGAPGRVPGSLHTFGLAVDLAWPHVDPPCPGMTREAHREWIGGAVSLALGADYDVVVEDDHIHIEFDPGVLDIDPE